ncbi:glycosyl transferase, partial [Escherichia coli]
YQAPGELLRCSWGKPWFSQSFNIVKNEAVFALYLILLFVALLTFNIDVFAVALLPLLAFTLLKIVQNRSLTDGLQSVINLIVRSAGLIKGIFYPVRDPLTPPHSKIIHE